MKCYCPVPVRRREGGSAVLLLLGVLALLFVIVAANNGSINSLRRELRLIERGQKRHWDQVAAATNLLPVSGEIRVPLSPPAHP